eukprot:COSAG01_NODE_18673_length_1060_cov_35.581686_1_plen_80_part_10
MMLPCNGLAHGYYTQPLTTRTTSLIPSPTTLNGNYRLRAAAQGGGGPAAYLLISAILYISSRRMRRGGRRRGGAAARARG